MSFQSTRPIRGATAVLVSEAVFEDISIHAPHTGRDAPAGAVVCIEVISIHAPHTGRDTPRTFSAFIPALFQSTRPIRGATAQSIITTSAPTNFNPRAPYGARRTAEGGKLYKITFQSTRPIRGATGAETLQDYLHLFQSTRPIRGATGMDNSGKTTLVFQSTRPIRGATPECLS